MSGGLEKIQEGILAQAREKAQEILAEAREKAQEILAQGEIERAQLRARIDAETDVQCREIADRARSADRQSRRLALLETKNRAIDTVLDEAKAALLARDDRRFESVWQGNVLLNNSVEAIFEAERQALRDKAFAVLNADG